MVGFDAQFKCKFNKTLETTLSVQARFITVTRLLMCESSNFVLQILPGKQHYMVVLLIGFNLRFRGSSKDSTGLSKVGTAGCR